MNAAGIIREIEQLDAAEFAKVQDFVLGRRSSSDAPAAMQDAPRPVYRRKEFPAAMDRVFRENQELLRLLAQ
jgi:hypothetical protein